MVNNLKRIIEFRINLSLEQSVIIVVVAAFAITYFMYSILAYLKSGGGHSALPGNFPLFMLNYLPVLMLCVLLFLIFRNPVAAAILTACFMLALTVANKMKINMRQDPVLPTDFGLLTEVAEIGKGFDPALLAKGVGFLILFIIVIVSSFLFFRTEGFNVKGQLISIGACVAVIFGLNSAVYANDSLYNSFPVAGNEFFNVNKYISRGFLYSFVHDISALKTKAPDSFNKQAYASEEASYEKLLNEDVPKPHLIMVMGESFSDMSENENLDFTGYVDPLANYKSICAEENSINGHVVVSSFGGGTSDTEFDVLTACVTRYIGSSKPSYNFVNKPMESLASYLKEMGYGTVGIHPGYSWFYNRQNVYRNFGFDRTFFMDDGSFSEKDITGGYVSDEAAVDFIIKNFDEHVENSDSPLFSFSVTIENHGPYESKFGPIGTRFSTDKRLSAYDKDLLSNYFYGISSADRSIRELVEHFRESDEPVVLVYFGDHLPGFSNGMDLFKKLEYDMSLDGGAEAALNLYKTPFLIWQNDAAKELADFSKIKERIGLSEEPVISASYLGTTLMELMGFQGLSPLFDLSAEARKALPVVTNENFMNGEGEYIKKLTEEEYGLTEKLRGWTYYKLFK